MGQNEEHDRHTAAGRLPAVQTEPCNPLRPPDLIIQDELHLLSGPLGTLAGLYETALDDLASWEVKGITVRPKVIASTATVRRAAEQVHALFWRRLAVFPPPLLDVSDSFFARRRDPSTHPGRRYLGICAPGMRLKSIEVRVFTTLLAAASRLFERHGAAADPWMTLVGYFNALRELAGARRLIEDDVRNRLRRAERRGLANRPIRVLEELTSRVASSEIRGILDVLSLRHHANAEASEPRPVDVLLATNMISVGVDVPRLGLMVAVGQPKATAEYIQATSRVGRDPSGPGLVVAIYNWSRPRDLSHYESFEQYHATFYRHVEALSVTPFAARAIDRGLSAVLVALLRQHGEELMDWNPNEGAHLVESRHPTVTRLVELIARRGEDVGGIGGVANELRRELWSRLDNWSRRVDQARSGGARLGYQGSATATTLLEPPALGTRHLWAVPNSLRETEPAVNLVLRTRAASLDAMPPFRFGGQPLPDGALTSIDDEETAEEATA